MTGYLNVIVAAISFFITASLGFLLIPILKKIKFGQTIKEIGPIWHKAKQGTPTMGGIMFIAGVVFSCIIGFLIYISSIESRPIDFKLDIIRFIGGIIMALAFGFVGFIDDYIKVVKKQNLGLRAREKTIMQILIAVTYVFMIYLSGDISTIIDIPFLGQYDLGIFYYVFAIVVIMGCVNSVNLTDGVDGLAGSVTFIAGIIFIIISGILGYTLMGIFASAVTAGCLGFLIWNFYPAKVFMGDTGSMFLGGCIVALAFGIKQPVFLIFIGIIYIIETLSVILQIISFKTTGKRIFKMSPIHHHFEMIGWSEVRIVLIFSIITALFGSIAIFSLIKI